MDLAETSEVVADQDLNHEIVPNKVSALQTAWGFAEECVVDSPTVLNNSNKVNSNAQDLAHEAAFAWTETTSITAMETATIRLLWSVQTLRWTHAWVTTDRLRFVAVAASLPTPEIPTHKWTSHLLVASSKEIRNLSAVAAKLVPALVQSVLAINVQLVLELSVLCARMATHLVSMLAMHSDRMAAVERQLKGGYKSLKPHPW